MKSDGEVGNYASSPTSTNPNFTDWAFLKSKGSGKNIRKRYSEWTKIKIIHKQIVNNIYAFPI